MKVIVLQNMAGEEVFRKGIEYDVSDEIGQSWINTGHAVAAEKTTKANPIIEEAVEDTTKVEKQVTRTKRK